jgi:hypothetical protein
MLKRKSKNMSDTVSDKVNPGYGYELVDSNDVKMGDEIYMRADYYGYKAGQWRPVAASDLRGSSGYWENVPLRRAKAIPPGWKLVPLGEPLQEGDRYGWEYSDPDNTGWNVSDGRSGYAGHAFRSSDAYIRRIPEPVSIPEPVKPTAPVHYFTLSPGTKIEPGDEVNTVEGWLPTTMVGHDVPENSEYRRKLGDPGEGYRFLNIGEVATLDDWVCIGKAWERVWGLDGTVVNDGWAGRFRRALVTPGDGFACQQAYRVDPVAMSATSFRAGWLARGKWEANEQGKPVSGN